MSISVNARKTINILGATGSIGNSTIDVIKQSDQDYKVIALTADKNFSELAKLAIETKAQYAVIADDKYFKDLKSALAGSKVKAMSGSSSIEEVAAMGADWTMSAINGSAGLAPTHAAVKCGKTVALANKESLVCAGNLLMNEVKKYGTNLIPVDSEHNAIFQVLDQNNQSAVERIILTASGGPFRGYDKKQLENVTLEQALKHPNWNMGQKITIGSATMMNKGLELIEAHYLFSIDHKNIEVVIHPQSIIHSMVGYIDGSVLAQMGSADMRIPIANALAWPKRINTNCQKLDFTKITDLNFSQVDNKIFPSIDLARKAIEIGDCGSIIFNSANEIAIDQYLSGNIKFTDIFKIVADSLDNIPPEKINNFDDVYNMISKSENFINKSLDN
ncbi:1-deoxy-D-xylulose-5-phosphate reductoisomerase [Rickettsiales bacterium]|nr:1-deoxy-D-xylulose-5-phosphate reductoisomerase [Rickettsiales bacterium]